MIIIDYRGSQQLHAVLALSVLLGNTPNLILVGDSFDSGSFSVNSLASMTLTNF